MHVSGGISLSSLLIATSLWCVLYSMCNRASRLLCCSDFHLSVSSMESTLDLLPCRLQTYLVPLCWTISRVSGAYPGDAPGTPSLKLEKIWFFDVKSWFFTRNTQNFSHLPPLGAIFLSAPPLTWNPGSALSMNIVLCVRIPCSWGVFHYWSY
jgi:hypothetical protein